MKWNNTKRIIKNGVLGLVCAFALFVPMLPVSAAGVEVQMTEGLNLEGKDLSKGVLVTLTEGIEAKSEPKVSASTVERFIKGNTILITGKEGDFYVINYQGQNLYVTTNIKGTDVMEEIVGESSSEEEGALNALDAEFQAEQEETTIIAEEVVRYHGERKKSIIIGGIAIVLVIVIFVLGFVSKKEKQDDEIKQDGEEKQNNDEK